MSQYRLEQWLDDGYNQRAALSEQDITYNLTPDATVQLPGSVSQAAGTTKGFADPIHHQASHQALFGDHTRHGNTYLAHSPFMGTAFQPGMSTSDLIDIFLAFQTTNQVLPPPLCSAQTARSSNIEFDGVASPSPGASDVVFQLPEKSVTTIAREQGQPERDAATHNLYSQPSFPSSACIEQVGNSNLFGETAPKSRGRQNSDASKSIPRCWEHGCNGRSFKTRRNYRRHIAEQEGLDSAVCSRCGTKFNRRTNCEKHEKTCLKDRDDSR